MCPFAILRLSLMSGITSRSAPKPPTYYQTQGSTTSDRDLSDSLVQLLSERANGGLAEGLLATGGREQISHSLAPDEPTAGLAEGAVPSVFLSREALRIACPLGLTFPCFMLHNILIAECDVMLRR